MSLVYAGIDEAGYGPLLGPLCVGLAVFRVPGWEPGRPAPDLWRLLNAGVCRKPGDRRGRVAVADSKRLKLPNDTRTRHPLCHLERGVLGFAGAGGLAAADAGLDDAVLLAWLGARLADAPWYAGPPLHLPLSCTAQEAAIAANRLAAALERAGVEVLDLRCVVVAEPRFNEIVRRTGTKAETTLTAVGEHLRHILSRWAGDDPVRIVCDRLGGRTDYGPLLCRELGRPVRVAEESARLSRYEIDACGCDAAVQFLPEAESAHLPVALASMVAKYVRELAMARFNRYWCALAPDLKPTAGYNADARRWLHDTADLLADQARHAMVRIA